MATRKPKTVLFRRRREQKTNYRKRIKTLAGRKLRLVVRNSNTRIYGQVIKFEQTSDKILASICSSMLKGHKWEGSYKNLSASYLTGYKFGKELISKNLNDLIFDSGVYQPKKGGKVYAFIKGVKDSGVDIAVNESAFPSEDRIAGKHLAKSNDIEKIKGKL